MKKIKVLIFRTDGTFIKCAKSIVEAADITSQDRGNIYRALTDQNNSSKLGDYIFLPESEYRNINKINLSINIGLYFETKMNLRKFLNIILNT